MNVVGALAGRIHVCNEDVMGVVMWIDDNELGGRKKCMGESPQAQTERTELGPSGVILGVNGEVVVGEGDSLSPFELSFEKGDLSFVQNRRHGLFGDGVDVEAHGALVKALGLQHDALQDRGAGAGWKVMRNACDYGIGDMELATFRGGTAHVSDGKPIGCFGSFILMSEYNLGKAKYIEGAM